MKGAARDGFRRQQLDFSNGEALRKERQAREKEQAENPPPPAQNSNRVHTQEPTDTTEGK